MSISKIFLRKIALPVAYSLGLGAILRKQSAHNALILMYHGVSVGNYAHINGRHLPVTQFEKHLIYLKKHFEVVPLSIFFDIYREKTDYKTNKKLIAITFDDGFVNNLETALPILKKYQTPATFFVTSHVLDGINLPIWADAVDIILYKTQKEKIMLDNKEFLKTDKTAIYNYIKSQNTQTRPRILDEFYTHYDLKKCLSEVPAEVWKTVNKEQLQKMASSPLVEIGTHSHLHYNLGNLSPEEIKYEIEHSKQCIENVIQKEVKSIAFPDGSYNDDVKKISLQAGLTQLLAVRYLFNVDIQDKTILSRWGIACSTTYESNILQINNAFKKFGIL